MNDRGRGSGLAFIIILIAGLIVAYLFIKQSGALGIVGTTTQSLDPVQAAKDVVNQVNEQQEKALDMLEGIG